MPRKSKAEKPAGAKTRYTVRVESHNGAASETALHKAMLAAGFSNEIGVEGRRFVLPKSEYRVLTQRSRGEVPLNQNSIEMAPSTAGARTRAMIRIVNLVAVLAPFAGFVAGAVLLAMWGFSWEQLAVFVAPFLLTSLGITIGFHRLFTHRAFETSKPVQAILAVLGSMAVEGPLFRWVAQHRRHHQCSDREGDPHSPHVDHDMSTWRGLLGGLWNAHMGWLFNADLPGLGRYIGDLRKSRMLRTLSATFPLWVALGLLIPAALGGLLTMSWSGAVLGFLWGGLARVFLVHHVTWSINSICHVWGSRPYETGDQSRNNAVFGVLALGEGWHNNHHAFPTSAKHGLRWWQIDLSYWIIATMKALGLAWRVKIPADHVLRSKLRHAPASA
jgi:stearoyl-CoA desaturase (delta-9 desaturase)